MKKKCLLTVLVIAVLVSFGVHITCAEKSGSADRDAYEKLIAYKTENYSMQSVDEFNHSLLNGDYAEFLEAYSTVIAGISPEDENYDFIMLTLAASGNEIYHEQVEKNTEFSMNSEVEKKEKPTALLPEEGKHFTEESAYDFLLYALYNINYTIPDPTVLTVEERDNAIQTIRAEMQGYVDGLSENEIMNGNFRDLLLNKANEFAGSVSTEYIKLYCEISNIEIHNEGTEMVDPITSETDMPDESFCSEEYQKLFDLQFEGYEDMTVLDFQRRVWKMTDQVEYRDLLERFSKSEILYALKDQNKTAEFLFYILEPLTAEKWETRDYEGCAATNFSYPEENATMEYVFTLSILKPDVVTVREYKAIRLNVINGMQDILNDKSKEELWDTSLMQNTIQNGIDNLIDLLQSKEISISIEFAYFPISVLSSDNESSYLESQEGEEKRNYANGTEEDYRSLLTLRKTDYKGMQLADFNMTLLEWANEDYDRMERIGEDTAKNDFRVALSEEECFFVNTTVFLSGMENGKSIQSQYTGEEEAATVCGEYLPQKTVNKNGHAAWCSLYYQFSYNIADKRNVTVGERDERITNVISGIRAFWNDADVEKILKMKEDEIVEELEKIIEIYSDQNIAITINKDQVQFECMDERNYTN